MKPIDILAARNIVGEGILWDSRRQLLWWTDIQGRELYRYDWARSSMQSRADCVSEPPHPPRLRRE